MNRPLLKAMLSRRGSLAFSKVLISEAPPAGLTNASSRFDVVVVIVTFERMRALRKVRRIESPGAMQASMN